MHSTEQESCRRLTLALDWLLRYRLPESQARHCGARVLTTKSPLRKGLVQQGWRQFPAHLAIDNMNRSARSIFIKLIGRRLRGTQESAHAEIATRTASSAPHRCRAHYAAVLCLAHAADLVRRNVADPQLGPDRHERQDHNADLRWHRGGGRSVRTARARQAKARYAAVDEKPSQSGNFFGDYGSAYDAGSICSTASMSDRAKSKQDGPRA